MQISDHGRMLGVKGERRLGTRRRLKRADRRKSRRQLRHEMASAILARGL